MLEPWYLTNLSRWSDNEFKQRVAVRLRRSLPWQPPPAYLPQAFAAASSAVRPAHHGLVRAVFAALAANCTDRASLGRHLESIRVEADLLPFARRRLVAWLYLHELLHHECQQKQYPPDSPQGKPGGALASKCGPRRGRRELLLV